MTLSSATEKRGLWIFFLIPIIWGGSFVITHNAVKIVPPGEFAFYRMFVAFICLFPFAIKYFKEINLKVILWSFIIAICSAGTILFQAFALTKVNSTQTAFYVTLNILFVPFIASLFKVAKLNLLEVMAVGIGVISILINFNGNLSAFGRGDIYGLMAALCVALNIVLTQKALQHINVRKIIMTFLSIAWGVVLLIYFPLHSTSAISIIYQDHSILFAVLFQGAMSTALAYFIQMKYQKEIGATNAALIMNLDLAFVSLFGYLNHEVITFSQLLSCIIAFISSIFKDLVIKVKSIMVNKK